MTTNQVTKTFPKSILRAMAFDEHDDTQYQKISDELLDCGRWDLHYEMTFSHGGKFYTSNYSRGATEQQDHGPYEYDGDDVICYEVKPVQKMVTVYEPVVADAN